MRTKRTLGGSWGWVVVAAFATGCAQEADGQLELRSAPLPEKLPSKESRVKETTAVPPAVPAKPTLKDATAVGAVAAATGTVTLTRADQGAPAAVGHELMPADKLETGADTKVRVILRDGSVVALGQKSALVFQKYDVTPTARTGTLKILVGKFWMQIAKLAGGETTQLDIETPNAVAGVRGTTLWGDTERDVICALEGSIEVTSTATLAATKAKKNKKAVKKLKAKKAKLAKQPQTPEVSESVRLMAGNCAAELSKGKLTSIMPKPEEVKAYLEEVTLP